MEKKNVRATRTNGRKDSNGVFKAGHNDRSFNLENAEHVDADRSKWNVYWDYLQGYNLADEKKNKTNNCKVSFDEEIRRLYIEIAEKYGVIIEKDPLTGKKHLEKNDFIIDRQEKEIENQKNKLEELTLKLNDPYLAGGLAYNLLAVKTYIVKLLWYQRPEGSALNNTDLAYIRLYMESNYGLTCEKKISQRQMHLSGMQQQISCR